MRKFIFAIAILFLTLNLFSQVDEREITVTNVVVPVKVLDGNKLVENLTIEDFELYEDGILQKIEALYLVQETNVERKETLKEFYPPLSRHFDLLFQTIDYNPKIAEAIDYFFNNVFRPEDTLTILTPVDNYNLSRNVIQKVSKEDISKAMQNIVRKDTNVGSSSYRSLMRDLKRIVGSISSVGRSEESAGEFSYGEGDTSSLELMFPRYRETLQKMETLRMVDYKKFIKFAASRKAMKRGQKNVFFFYQREFRPEISPGVQNRLSSTFQDKPQILSEIQDLFNFYRRDFAFDTEKVIQAFADASISFNLIFMNKEPERSVGISMREQSEDAFNAFSKLAEATGGIVDSSQNPAPAFINALDNSQSYYLLYYSPSDYKKDGKFKSIEVKLKNKNFKIAHRLGYFTN
jgi:hypothetical protein